MNKIIVIKILQCIYVYKRVDRSCIFYTKHKLQNTLHNKKMCSTSLLFCFRILTVIYNGDKNINAVEKKLWNYLERKEKALWIKSENNQDFT